MIKITAEMRAEWRALELGLCPKCGKSLEVKNVGNEDEELTWFCPTCGFFKGEELMIAPIQKKTKPLMTIRVSEEAFDSLKAEARLTDRSVSQVVRSRIKLHVKKLLGQITEREELIRAELKNAMHRAVMMSDTKLEKHTLWMRGHIERENAEHMLSELAIYEAELAHRQPLAPSTNIFDRLPPFKQ